jgi:hypothetical protein
MIDGLWSHFPRLIERNVNGLLDEAEPNALRKLHIYRSIKTKGLTRGGVEEFLRNLDEFFSRPRVERHKSQFDAFLERPMDHELYALFHLDFHNAVIPDEALYNLASWAHNLIRVSRKTTAAYMSQDVLLRTLRRLTNPNRSEKAFDITFADFCVAWKRTVTKLFGSDQDKEFLDVIRELEWLDAELKKTEERAIETALVAGVYLSNIEIDWLIKVRAAAEARLSIPDYPTRGGPSKRELRDLERVASLYTIAETSRLSEIVRNRERIRATLIGRCDSLLGEDKKIASAG